MRLCWFDAVYVCLRRQSVHGRITKLGNKWLRWVSIEVVQPAISTDGNLFAYYERPKLRKRANAAKVATAPRLLTIVYRVLSQERLYQTNRKMTENRK